MDQQTAHRILSGCGGGAGGAILRAGLSLASAPYSALVRTRRWAHRNHLIPEDSLAQYKRPGSGHPIRVISVGNLTTGGTGKTPMVAWVAHRLRAMGLRPGVLLRGYKAAGGLSDEAQLLKELCGGCPVVPNPDRLAGAMEAMAAGADVLVLDDGFQHLRLKRDLDIVLIDATNPFGYGHCLPRGLLREPLSALRYADEIVITHSDAMGAAELAGLRERLSRLAPQAGLHLAAHVPTHFLELDGLQADGAGGLGNAPYAGGSDAGCHGCASQQPCGTRMHPSTSRGDVAPVTESPRPGGASHADGPGGAAGEGGLRHPLTVAAGRKVLAFCGIGNPQPFFASLGAMGAEVVGTVEMDDHVEYTTERLANIRKKAIQTGAEILVTTRKDGVKLQGTLLGRPVWQLVIEMDVVEGEAALVEKMRQVCAAGGGAQHVRRSMS